MDTSTNEEPQGVDSCKTIIEIDQSAERLRGLLALPPELRNQIYGYVLVEPSRINIVKGFKIPGLLAVCRQIRHEAMPMFYGGNYFVVTIEYCDARFYARFWHHVSRVVEQSCQFGLPTYHAIIRIRLRRMDWDNLLDWCHMIYRGVLRHVEAESQCEDIYLGILGPIEIESQNSAATKVIYAAHNLALALCNFHAPWKSCMNHLYDLRLVAKELDSVWED